MQRNTRPSESYSPSTTSSDLDIVAALHMSPSSSSNTLSRLGRFDSSDLPWSRPSTCSFASYSPPNSATVSSFEHPLLQRGSFARSSASQSIDESSMAGIPTSALAARRGSAPSETSSSSKTKGQGKRHADDASQPKRSPTMLARHQSSGTPPYLVRSTIPINPFASLRRRLFARRTGRDRPEHQLISELLESLDQYIEAFDAPLIAQAVIQVDRNDLVVITDEIVNLVAEINETCPEFQQACSRGNYGPFSIPNSHLTGLQSSAERFAAYEPETPEELLNGQFWAVRLRRDLTDTSSSENEGTRSPNYSPYLAHSSLPSTDDGAGSPHSSPMQQNDSIRSMELLKQGQARWETFRVRQRQASGGGSVAFSV